MLRHRTDKAWFRRIVYDIRPGNGPGLFLQPRSLHGASTQHMVHLRYTKLLSILSYNTLGPGRLTRLQLDLSKWKFNRQAAIDRPIIFKCYEFVDF